MLARFAVFERQFFNGQTVNVKEENNFPDPKEIEQHEAFMTSNRLPIKNVNDLNRFEQNLKNSEFLNATVSVNTFGYSHFSENIYIKNMLTSYII